MWFGRVDGIIIIMNVLVEWFEFKEKKRKKTTSEKWSRTGMRAKLSIFFQHRNGFQFFFFLNVIKQHQINECLILVSMYVIEK